MTRMLCVGMPEDWWSVPDDANRLALMLCSVCPSLPSCPPGDPEPHGIIRAGRAFGNEGERLPLCDCGQPVPYIPRGQCYTCWPSSRTVIPKRKHRGRPRLVDIHVDKVVELLAAGHSPTRIARLIDVPGSTVRYWVQHYRLRPQGSSTVVDRSDVA